MNTAKVSLGILFSAALIGFASCQNKKEVTKNSKEKAMNYLSGKELFLAQEYAKKQPSGDASLSSQVNYWDSLNIEAKSKKAYIEGSQMIRDSIDGKEFSKPEYNIKLDTIINENPEVLVYNLEKEYATGNDITSIEYYRQKLSAPKRYNWTTDSSSPNEVHYWNLITLAGKQADAFKKGAEDERKKSFVKTLEIKQLTPVQ